MPYCFHYPEGGFEADDCATWHEEACCFSCSLSAYPLCTCSTFFTIGPIMAASLPVCDIASILHNCRYSTVRARVLDICSSVGAIYVARGSTYHAVRAACPKCGALGRGFCAGCGLRLTCMPQSSLDFVSANTATYQDKLYFVLYWEDFRLGNIYVDSHVDRLKPVQGKFFQSAGGTRNVVLYTDHA